MNYKCKVISIFEIYNLDTFNNRVYNRYIMNEGSKYEKY